MLTLDKKTLHAVEAMLTIAAHSGEQPISGKEIASQHDLPPRYLEQMLQRLVRADLLRGVRGPRGGYVLAREKRRISLADILNATQIELEYNDPLSSSSKLTSLLTELQKDMSARMENITLQELVPHPHNMKMKADFAI